MVTLPLARFGAEAVIPDQLPAYVAAVSGLESVPCGSCLLHRADGEAVLAGYPLHDPLDSNALNQSVALALNLPGLRRLTVLSARRPDAAPPEAKTLGDSYWSLPLPPPPPGQKLRNTLKRAGREVEIVAATGAKAWTDDCAELAENFCRRKGAALGDGSRYLFGKLGGYLAASPETVLFSARRADGRLAALAIADYSALATAFYMFALRAPDAPPGSADLTLKAICGEASARGCVRLNLGLGINSGVEFFKKKWGASQFLPYAETSWNPEKRRKGWLARLFGG